jgi:hypothetical protein
MVTNEAAEAESWPFSLFVSCVEEMPQIFCCVGLSFFFLNFLFRFTAVTIRTLILLVSRLRMRGAVPPFTHTSSQLGV